MRLGLTDGLLHPVAQFVGFMPMRRDGQKPEAAVSALRYGRSGWSTVRLRAVEGQGAPRLGTRVDRAHLALEFEHGAAHVGRLLAEPLQRRDESVFHCCDHRVATAEQLPASSVDVARQHRCRIVDD
eukprot:6270506-Prymnesium_polylepis.1